MADRPLAERIRANLAEAGGVDLPLWAVEAILREGEQHFIERLTTAIVAIPLKREVDGDRSWDSFTEDRTAKAFRADVLAAASTLGRGEDG